MITEDMKFDDAIRRNMGVFENNYLAYRLKEIKVILDKYDFDIVDWGAIIGHVQGVKHDIRDCFRVKEYSEELVDVRVYQMLIDSVPKVRSPFKGKDVDE